MRRNLVVIICDQLRKDCLGAYGNPYVHTPNIDSLVKEGCRFDRYNVCNPICSPNRTTLFTGMYPHNHGIYTNGLEPHHLVPGMAAHLAANGYNTCNIGKMHLEPTDCRECNPYISHEDRRYWRRIGDSIDWYGPYFGFEHVELTIGHTSEPIAHYGKWFHEHGGKDDMHTARKDEKFKYCGVTDIPLDLHDSSFVGTRSAEFIRSYKDEKPFFLVASFPDPHFPYNPPREVAEKYLNTEIKMPTAPDDDLETRPVHYREQKAGIWHRCGCMVEKEGMSEEERQAVQSRKKLLSEFNSPKAVEKFENRAKHLDQPLVSKEEAIERIHNTYAMVDLIDQNVGRIIQALKDSGRLENTVVIFTSDHGELLGDHGLWLKGPFFFNGLVSVPLIFRIPGYKGEREIENLASTVDIFPTCCSLLGVDAPEYCDGVSLVPTFEGEDARKACLTEYRNGYFENDVNTMSYFDGRYRFVSYQGGEAELTDVEKDPDELVNLLAPDKEGKLTDEQRRLRAEFSEKTLNMYLCTGSKFPHQYCYI